nr:hypothetical protein [Tanacetum cinerariifolium]
MASKDAGGLSVANLFALNMGLMFKWVWRFITQKNSLWAKVITAIHGDDGKIGKTVNPTFPSIWLNIIQEVDVMKTKCIDVIQMTILKEILESCILSDTKDRWTWSLEGSGEFSVSSIRKTIDVAFLQCGNVKTRRKSRGGAEQIQMTILKEILESCILSDTKDRWTWSLEGSGEFSVSSIRKTIDVAFLQCGNVKTRKLDKFKGHDFRRWQKKMHFLLTTLKVVYVLTTSMPELLEDATMEAIKIRAKPVMEQYNKLLRILGQYTQHGLKVNESISVSSIIDKLPPSCKDFKHTLKHGKDDLSLVQLGSHLRIDKTLRAQDSNTGKGKEVRGPSVNMTEEGGKNKHHKQKKVKSDPMRTTVVLVPTKNLSWNVESAVRLVTSKGIAIVVDAIAWWIESGATTHVCKDRCWFKIFEPVEDGSILYICLLLLLLLIPHYGMIGHVHYKRMLEMSKDDLIPAIDENSDKCTTCNKKYVITFIDDASRFCYVYLLHAKDKAFDKFRIYKTEVELQQNDLIKTLCTNRGGEYYDPVFSQSVGVIHETTAPYTPQQNGVAERKNKAIKEMFNSMLSYSGLSDRFWGEAMLTVCYLLSRVPNKRNKTTPYELWFYVIEHNDSVSINSIIESRDAIFDENRFYSIPRPNDIIPNSDKSQRDDHFDDVPSEISKPRKGCKWIFKRKMKVDGTIDKFKDRLIAVGLSSYSQSSDHQMDVKTTFLNGDLDEEVYMKQPEGFIMPGNEHKVFDKTKKFLSSRFSMKDTGEADVILGIKIKRENKGIVITQSHYIEKLLKKFNREDCSPVSTLMDPVEKLNQIQGNL